MSGYRALWFALLVILVAPVQAAERERIGLFGRATRMVDGAQSEASRRFNGFILSVDDFFGNADTADIEQSSWARVRLDGVKEVGEKLRPLATVRLKVVLPQTQDRLRLLFSTEDESLEDQAARQRAALDDGITQRSASLALRFIRSVRESTNVNFDLGGRYRDDALQIFGRLTASITERGDDGWQRRLSNSFIYYSASGYENRLRLDFRRGVGSHGVWQLRNSVESRWQKAVRGARLSGTIGMYGELSARSAIAVEGLLAVHSSPTAEDGAEYRGHAFRIRYRRSAFRDWLWFEVWPGLSWPAENGYRQEITGLVRVELMFGDY